MGGHYIDLDRRRRLVYMVDFFEIMKAKTGWSEVEDFEHLDPVSFAIVVWCGLRWQDPLLKIKAVERMIWETTKGDEKALEKMTLPVLSAIDNYNQDRDTKIRAEIYRKMGE